MHNVLSQMLIVSVWEGRVAEGRSGAREGGEEELENILLLTLACA